MQESICSRCYTNFYWVARLFLKMIQHGDGKSDSYCLPLPAMLYILCSIVIVYANKNLLHLGSKSREEVGEIGCE